MRRVIALLLVFAMLKSVSGAVVISQVLYDPAGTESGGEAVELRNDGDSAVDVSGWFLASEASATDATIPAGVVLGAGRTYLIADVGWNSGKDNPDWRSADLEETITLANEDSGIALKDANGNIKDAVGWGDVAGIKQGLYEGVPAEGVAAGKALVRLRDTDNNAADFAEQDAGFFSDWRVTLIVNVTQPQNLPFPEVTIVDDDSMPGIQLRPVAGETRKVRIEVNYSGNGVSVFGFGRSVELVNGKGELTLDYWQPPGNYDVVVMTPVHNRTISVSVLELKAVSLESNTVRMQASPGRTASGSVSVRNTGNVPVDLYWTGADLTFGAYRIPFANVQADSVTINPAGKKTVGILLSVPQNATPGEYKTMLRVKVR